jgi:hypothetical protein
VTATEYAGADYGVGGDEIQKLAANLHAKAKKALKAGKARAFDGDIESAIRDQA